MNFKKIIIILTILLLLGSTIASVCAINGENYAVSERKHADGSATVTYADGTSRHFTANEVAENEATFGIPESHGVKVTYDETPTTQESAVETPEPVNTTNNTAQNSDNNLLIILIILITIIAILVVILVGYIFIHR